MPILLIDTARAGHLHHQLLIPTNSPVADSELKQLVKEVNGCKSEELERGKDAIETLQGNNYLAIRYDVYQKDGGRKGKETIILLADIDLRECAPEVIADLRDILYQHLGEVKKFIENDINWNNKKNRGGLIECPELNQYFKDWLETQWEDSVLEQPTPAPKPPPRRKSNRSLTWKLVMSSGLAAVVITLMGYLLWPKNATVPKNPILSSCEEQLVNMQGKEKQADIHRSLQEMDTRFCKQVLENPIIHQDELVTVGLTTDQQQDLWKHISDSDATWHLTKTCFQAVLSYKETLREIQTNQMESVLPSSLSLPIFTLEDLKQIQSLQKFLVQDSAKVYLRGDHQNCLEEEGRAGQGIWNTLSCFHSNKTLDTIEGEPAINKVIQRLRQARKELISDCEIRRITTERDKNIE